MTTEEDPGSVLVALSAETRRDVSMQISVDEVVRLGGRQLRRRHLLTSVGAAVAVAAMVGSLAVVRLGMDDGSAPTAGHGSQSAGPEVTSQPSTGSTPGTASASPNSMAAYEWAMALPQGSTDATLLAGTTLRLSDGRLVDLGGQSELLGISVKGPVVFIEKPNIRESGYFVVGPQGQVMPLPSSPARAQNGLLSPDGRLVAYGSIVLDLETDQVVSDLPANAVSLNNWISDGLVYSSGGKPYLWRPGSSPQALSGNPGAYFGQGPVGIRPQGSCTEFVTFDVARGATVQREVCDGGKFLTVSPDGRLALDDGLHVLSLSDGKVTSLVSGGIDPIYAYTSTAWTGPHTVVFPIPATSEAPGETTVVFVQCDLSSSKCMRVSDAMPHQASWVPQAAT